MTRLNRDTSKDTQTSITDRKYHYIKVNGKYYDVYNPFKPVTFTIVPTPSTAITALFSLGKEGEKSINVPIGSKVHWYVGELNRPWKSGTETVTQDQTKAVELDEAPEQITGIYNQNHVLVPVSTLSIVNSDSRFNRTYDFNVGLSGNINFSALKRIDGNEQFYELFKGNTTIVSAQFPVLEDIGCIYDAKSSMGYYMFSGCTSLKSVFFPRLIQIGNASGNSNSVFNLAFEDCSSLETVLFNNLESVYGNVLTACFRKCTSLRTIRFRKLKTILGQALYGLFAFCTNIEDVYFPAFTNETFGTGSQIGPQLQNIFLEAGTDVIHKIHFPSNLESTISQLQSYPLFGGTSGYVQLLFDLPATS